MPSPIIYDPKNLITPTLLTTSLVTQFTSPAAEAGTRLSKVILSNRGLTDFAQVWHLDATVYVDETTDAADIGTTDVSIFQTDSSGLADRFYVGSATKFSHIGFTLGTVGTGTPTIVAAYWNGAAWTDLTLAAHSYVDGTNALKNATGEISFLPPSDWATVAVNGVTQFYIEFRVTANFTIAPVGTLVRKGTTSVCKVTIHVVPSGSTATVSNIFLADLIVPPIGTGRPSADVEELAGFILDTGDFISMKSGNTENQVINHMSGIDMEDS